MSPQQGAWRWQTPVMFSATLHCWQSEWASARSEPSLKHFPHLFCTCLSALYLKAFSVFLICITSSILFFPCLFFCFLIPFYTLLHVFPTAFAFIPNFNVPLFSLLFKSPVWYSISPPAASSNKAASLYPWSLLILTPLPHSTATIQTYPSVTHLILYLHISSPL